MIGGGGNGKKRIWEKCWTDILNLRCQLDNEVNIYSRQLKARVWSSGVKTEFEMLILELSEYRWKIIMRSLTERMIDKRAIQTFPLQIQSLPFSLFFGPERVTSSSDPRTCWLLGGLGQWRTWKDFEVGEHLLEVLCHYEEHQKHPCKLWWLTGNCS